MNDKRVNPDHMPQNAPHSVVSDPLARLADRTFNVKFRKRMGTAYEC